MKAIISNRIYLKVEHTVHLKTIMEALTYKIELKHGKGQRGKFNSVEIIKNYRYTSGVLSIPQGRVDLIPEGYTIEDKRVYNEVPFPDPKFELREGQLAVYNEVNDSGFINALVGWGKTFTALHIARKLGQKTLIVTHTTMLRDQWVKEIHSLYGIEPGIIGSGNFDIEDHAIVVGNVQTIVKHLARLSKEFGTIILDEAHHVPATTFSSIIDSSYARYRIALSGTMLRKDGKHIIFRDYFGSEVHKPPQSHTLNPVIKILQSGIRLTGDVWAKKLNNLLYDEEYQAYVAVIAKTQIAKGHKVLIPAERVEFLQKVKELIGTDCVLITGETSFEEREHLIKQVKAGTKKCIAGSKQIFSEGISVDNLSCLILCSPSSNEINLEQLVGRIMRLDEDKLDPEVIDINFSSPAERAQNAARLAFYIGKGWEVRKI